MPKTFTANTAIFPAKDLIPPLQNLSPATPFAQLGSAQLIALRQLANIFDTTVTKTSSKGATHDTSPRVQPTKPSPSVDKPSLKVDPAIPRSPH
jgi:hypothetical protein